MQKIGCHLPADEAATGRRRADRAVGLERAESTSAGDAVSPTPRVFLGIFLSAGSVLLLEIARMQEFVPFLGHPVHAMTAVLTSPLAFAARVTTAVVGYPRRLSRAQASHSQFQALYFR